jgi:tetratricopeptide (TPR) repeat protein
LQLRTNAFIFHHKNNLKPLNMKNLANYRKQLFIIGMSVLLMAFYGCNPLKKMQKDLDKVKIKVVDDVLEVHADSINVYFDAYVAEKYFHKKAIMKLDPFLAYKTDSIFMTPFLLAGEKVDLQANQVPASNVVPFKSGATIPYREKLRYEPGMKNSAIYIVGNYKIDSDYDELDNCVCDAKKYKISDGVIATSQTVQPTETIGIAGSFQPQRIVANGVIYYENDKYIIKKGQTESKDFKLPFVLDPVFELVKKEGYQIEGVTMHSQASPDGAFDRNEFLAKSRKSVSYKYMVKRLKDIGFEQVYDSGFYKKDQTYEDWEGLKQLISKSDLSIKEDILKIIASDLPLDEKEANIRKLGQWDVLATTILPKLRKTEIAMTAKTIIRDLDKLNELYKANQLDQFHNKQELLYLAYNTESLDDQTKLYKYYNEKYPDEYVGLNNLAGVHILKGEYDDALDILTDLNKKFPNEKEILQNAGICYRIKGEYDTALYIYEQAEAAGADVRNNKGILYIKTADYELAIQTFEEDRYDYNRALAYTLKKDFNGAKNVLDKIDDKTAEDFYLRAIVGARSKDIDLLTTSLTRAIKLDGSIRQRAKEDLEFRNYWDKAEFENALR